MRSCPWVMLLLLAPALGLLSLPDVRAQGPDDSRPDRSYVEVHPPSANADAGEMLRRRLEQLEGLSETQTMLQKLLADPRARDLLQNAKALGVTPEMIEDWKQKYASGDLEQGVDPKLKEMLQHTIQQHPKGLEGLGFTNEQRARIANTIQRLPALAPPSMGKVPGWKMPPGMDFSSGQHGKGLPFQPPPPSGLPGNPAGQVAPSETPPSLSQKFSDWLLEQTSHLEGLDDVLKNSPAIQRAVEHLEQAWSSRSGKLGLNGQLEELLAHARDKSLWSGGSIPHLPELSNSSLPHISWPHGTLPNVHFPEVAAPHLGNVGAPGPDSAEAVLWVVAAVVVIVLAWRVSQMWRAGEWHRGGRPTVLGPWPVAPGAVRTREQLVQAFEYLSLLRLGTPARSWNHLHIADALGGPADPSRTAATELAALYEQARYAPARESLSDHEIRTARQSLTLLAGTPRA